MDELTNNTNTTMKSAVEYNIHAILNHIKKDVSWLSESTGIDETLLCEIICGNADVSVAILSKIASCLNCEIKVLFVSKPL